MKVYHPARPNFRDLVVKWERHSAHDYVTAQSRSGGRVMFLLKTLAMVPSPLAEIPRILVSDRVSGLRNKIAAFVCLSRIRFRRAVIMFRLIAGTDPSVYSGAWNRAKP
jgi:hypothetical protein